MDIHGLIGFWSVEDESSPHLKVISFFKRFGASTFNQRWLLGEDVFSVYFGNLLSFGGKMDFLSSECVHRYLQSPQEEPLL